ncbi:MAG: Alanine-tRNA ligase [Candidatus Roizmanbacteria bacterium GW2011_GWA2_36_23]|uniref:alanine--tRNA ligase n=1 Tax=Candidatus Roizmanbacteria bacterium GW2011_GWA2_36_23 TaxID=1618480 RepID=A0A0G0HE77_9BACT|nr:MAG: Alanine-tRNA ligase [Candidatus Roizmanbacteria bacterium GW2011_GWA2_36_23]
MLSHIELRQKFADFWKSKDHKEVPSIPLIPQNDPTTLFTGSGMQQLVPYLLGEPHPLGKKLYNIQPCVRVQDIDEVGDNRHTTTFEMMGNWSLGTYFKKEQLAWYWEFITKELGLLKEKLYVSVFEGYKNIPFDEETYNIWKELGVPENKIFRYDATKNWWSRAGVPDNMPPGEPGGPTSEVFYEFTQVEHNPRYGEKCHPNCDCGRFLEIGNSVFMQYKKGQDGNLSPLPANNVDFGGGVERHVTALNNDPDVFKTDLYKDIIKSIEEVSGKEYKNNEKLMRIIADHLKGSILMIINGIVPTNKEQGYVLRRLLRRSAIKMKLLSGYNLLDFSKVVKGIFKTYQGVLGIEEKQQQPVIIVINEEIKKFNLTLDRGLKILEKLSDTDLNEKNAFDLFQTHGFPFEISKELFKQKGVELNKIKYDLIFKKHQDLSRQLSVGKFKGGLADQGEKTIKYHTATHLIHQALFDVLGNDVRQEGSNITGERLRFDYYSSKKPTDEDIKQVEKIVNDKVTEALPVQFKIMPKEEAIKIGAKSFFREKYPDMVKVYFISSTGSLQAAYSKEFCGGAHVQNTKEIGKVEIFKTEKIGSNLFRIYAK